MQGYGTLIGRLATSARVEAGLIEGQRTFLERNDACVNLEAVVVLQIKTCGGWCCQLIFVLLGMHAAVLLQIEQ